MHLEAIKAAISRHSNGNVQVDAVAATPVPGIFEVTNGREVFYADSTGRYAFVDGRLVDIAEKRDLTQARLEQLAAIPFDELPIDLAIKTVRGNGARKLAVFEDPACPVCRSMQDTLAALDNVTIYTFAYPVVSPESIPAAVSAWCEPGDQRDRQWQTYMDGAPPPQAIAPQCEPAMQQVGRIVEFGRTREIRSTPTLVLGDGRRIVGAMPREELDAALTRAAAR
ncbi:DsbC family protein [Aromatoleum aromaticum]|uniref:DsbC family protein n=1 Tax=Aromatoleum aromaticum TaxID=551760 RepID=UPI0002D4772B|nr:DsbC family protein [Aromatoleum aromaticum]